MTIENEVPEVGRALSLVGDILGTDFLQLQPRWLAEAAFVLLVINLDHALRALSAAGSQVNFADDLVPGDVIDIISGARNAGCHIASKRRRSQSGTVYFNVQVGNGTLIRIGSQNLHTNPYDDDTAVFYGEHVILLNRHIRRAHAEATELFSKKTRL